MQGFDLAHIAQILIGDDNAWVLRWHRLFTYSPSTDGLTTLHRVV